LDIGLDMAFMHASVERQIREWHQYPLDKPMRQFFREYPDLSYAMCLEMEAKLSAAVAAHTERTRWSEESKRWIQQVMDDKDARIADRDARLADRDALLREKDARIADRDALMQERVRRITEKMELEKSVLSAMLERADTAILRLRELMQA
jgi:hypothetical protein